MRKGEREMERGEGEGQGEREYERESERECERPGRSMRARENSSVSEHVPVTSLGVKNSVTQTKRD